jgi:hypothetical protein
MQKSQPPTPELSEERPVTRKAAAEFLTAQGYPISSSTLTKMCAPADNTGPRSIGRWGRYTMYLPSELLRWARARLKPHASAEG